MVPAVDKVISASDEFFIRKAVINPWPCSCDGWRDISGHLLAAAYRSLLWPPPR